MVSISLSVSAAIEWSGGYECESVEWSEWGEWSREHESECESGGRSCVSGVVSITLSMSMVWGVSGECETEYKHGVWCEWWV